MSPSDPLTTPFSLVAIPQAIWRVAVPHTYSVCSDSLAL